MPAMGDQTIERPGYVTFIGMWLIVSQVDNLSNFLWQVAIVDLIGIPATWTSFDGLLRLGNSAAVALCGYGILQGYSWSRWLYLARSFEFVVVYPVASRLDARQTFRYTWLGLVMAAVLMFLLFCPRANAWFGTERLQVAREGAT
jgi:hypothetical protein